MQMLRFVNIREQPRQDPNSIENLVRNGLFWVWRGALGLEVVEAGDGAVDEGFGVLFW